jgi:tRNA modification GTPase
MILKEQTIIAQCTPQGSGAIAMLRLSGDQAIVIASKICKLPGNRQTLLEKNSHTVHYGQIIDQNNNLIDQAMFIVMQGPKTFTGEHTVEITCHNNPFIVDKIINLAIIYGARLAQKGEFAKRAFLNDKIDLTQAEAINSLIHAHTENALRKSLAQLTGNLNQWSEQIENSLLRSIAFCEASFEFIDEEIDFSPQIKNELTQIIDLISQAQASNQIEQQIKEGLKVAIIGSVNAGKSSLFNALLKKDRAIVTPIAGTTRDVIEAGIYTNQNYLTLIDTAGLRQTQDHIEQIGITKSFEQAKLSDIILLTFDASRKITPLELNVYQEIFDSFKHKIILVANKADQPNLLELPKDFSPIILVSTVKSKGLDHLNLAIKNKIDEILAQDTAPFLLNQRQFNILSSVRDSCEQMLKMLVHPEFEIISLHLNETLQILANLSGKSITEKSMDTIFREFCVGK